jgi:multidrug efflux pump subunit AcrB
MLIGGCLAVVILFLFLGQLRATVAAALSLPVAVLITFFGMKLAGDTLNLMSLGGLAVAIGLIIDDAVVVVENIERRLALGAAAATKTIELAVDEVVRPVTGSTLTTVVVFAPLGLLEGVVGDFFRSFSIALAISVVISLVLAFTLIPVVLTQISTDDHSAGSQPAKGLSLLAVESGYERLLTGALRRPGLALAAAVLLIVGAVGLGRSMETGFLPDMDEGGFILDYWTPTGSSLDETDRQMKIIEGILHADPDIQAFSRRTGAELGFAITPANRGDFTVLLKPRSGRHASAEEVMDRVRGKVEAAAPAVRVEFVQLLQDIIGDLAGAPEPVEVKLFSPDQRAAERAARSLAERLDSVPGLVDLYNGVPGENPELQVTLDPVRLQRLGLSPAEAGNQVRAALFGASAGQAREADRLVPIRARLTDSARFDPATVASLPIVGSAGWAPLGALAEITDSGETSELLRENLRPLARVTGRVEGAGLGSVMKQVRQAAARLALPPGVSLEFGGQYASQQAAFRQLLLVLGLAAGAVLVVLVAQFGEFRGPIAILMAAPLGLAGALFALWLTHVAFNVASFMGLILLIGLVVKNGIILLDAARRQRHEGASITDALIGAGRLRLRPILMTTLCTLAGLLPLALGWGAGADLQRPLAVAVVGGLVLSTLVTLILLPVGLAALGALGKVKPD